MMHLLVMAVVVATFLFLSMLHVYWALDGRTGSQAAIPSIDGVAAFKPSLSGTLAVAFLLLLAGLAVLIEGRFRVASLPIWASSIPAIGVATVLAARAIGDFRLVGFFRKPNSSRFAKLDALYYSPLCLALAAAILFLVIAD